MSQLLSYIRRKRRPLQAATTPASADFVCPHCGRLAGAIVPAAAIEPRPTVPVMADHHPPVPVVVADPVSVPVVPLESLKAKSSHAKNRAKSNVK